MDTGPASPAAPSGWQPLPVRGAVLAAMGNALGLGVPMTALGFVLGVKFDWTTPWPELPLPGVPVVALAGLIIGGWFGYRRHRRVRWRLDDIGFALRRGNLWRSETHVPISRVQHLDLKHGPIERALGLATLVVHTAGTRMATVNISGLDARDAEHLRDRLAHQLDHDDAL